MLVLVGDSVVPVVTRALLPVLLIAGCFTHDSFVDKIEPGPEGDLP